MASIILGTVASGLAPGIGGLFLGALGSIAGGRVDQALGLGSHVTGPRLESLAVQDSRYGAGIPTVYGHARTAGNVIWSTDLIQTEHDSNLGGKGGGGVSTTSFTYSVHCAVGIARGPIGGIGTIWADSTVIYQNGVWTPNILESASIYLGNTSQAPDAFMESILGAGNVPAYRNLAYIVFEGLQLQNFGNRLPNLTFEIVPSVATTNPLWLGGVDAGVDQRTPTAQTGNMLPIPLSGTSQVREVLVGGYDNPGSSCVFQLVSYDVTGNAPIELAHVSSPTFATNTTPDDSGWALAPDKRFVAMFVLSSHTPNTQLAIYDTVTGAFGAICNTSLDLGDVVRQLAWLDAQHFVVDDVSGGVRGAHVFLRAGMNIVDLGFFGVWGAGSSTTRTPLSALQYTPYAGGLLNYMTDNTTGTYFSAIYARTLAWKNNTLVIGAAYTLASGITTVSGSAPHANLMRTGDKEWTLCFATELGYDLMSFEPGASSAAITRPMQSFAQGFGASLTQFPVFFGDRIVLVQSPAFGANYCLSDVVLNAGNFTLTVDGATVTGNNASLGALGAIRLDRARILMLGIGGFGSDIQQLGIIERGPAGDGLDAIVGDILDHAGYAGSDYDVSALSGVTVEGFALPEPMTARTAIEPLQAYYPFDLVESADQLVAVVRHGTADTAIASSEWRAAAEGHEPPPALNTVRAQEIDLPVEVDVDYLDTARDYEVNCQRARRLAPRSRTVQKISLPIVCDSTIAKQIAETRLYTLWAERELVKLSVSRRWLALDPGDVVDLGNGNFLRVTSVNQAGGLMEIEGFYVNPSVYLSAAAADAGQATDLTANAALNSYLYLMDLPLLRGTDDEPGFYATATGLPGWKGASLWRAADGVNYTQVASLPNMAIAGAATTVLANGQEFYLDAADTVNVQLINGSLSSCTPADLLNGANAALLGNEIIQFQTATLTGPGLYTLSNLLRGRRGTENQTATHATGENFVVLTSGTAEFVPALLTDRNATYEFRALTNGQSLGDAQDNNFTYGLATLRPFSPVNVTGTRASGTGSDLAISWMRRARLNAGWVDYIDVPLDEPTELYDLEILNGGSVVRTFSSISSNAQTYTAAQQSTDWGTVPASFTVKIYQISSRYGRGDAATTII